MTNKLFGIILIGLASSLLTLLLIETALEKSYSASKIWARKAVSELAGFENAQSQFQDNCEIPETAEVFSGSTVILGHAYGAPGASGGFISEAAERFILKHAGLLEGVVFSGDVFRVPSAARWQKLQALSDRTATRFYVAPGNHDVGFGDNPSRDIWNFTDYSADVAAVNPVQLSGFDVLLEDSVVSGWQMSGAVIDALQNTSQDRSVVLVRHHIAVKEMLPIANSQAGFSGELPALGSLSAQMPRGVTIISGDSGAFPRLPRIACLTDGNLTFIASGIGETAGDTALLLHEGKIWKTPL